jgi:predicted kinase
VELEEPNARPGLLLVGGLPGTGKSTLAQALGTSAGFEVIRSDVIRKHLAGLSDRTPSAAHAEIYSPEWTEQTYAACLREAEHRLFEGSRVLVDATFRQERFRRRFLDAARRWCVPSALILCEADPVTVRQRLEQRRHDVSDADWGIYEKLSAEWEEPGPMTRPMVRQVSTAGDRDTAASIARDVLRQLGVWDQ